MESTGVYGEKLAYFLVGNNYALVIESPLKVKRLSIQREARLIKLIVSKLLSMRIDILTN